MRSRKWLRTWVVSIKAGTRLVWSLWKRRLDSEINHYTISDANQTISKSHLFFGTRFECTGTDNWRTVVDLCIKLNESSFCFPSRNDFFLFFIVSRTCKQDSILNLTQRSFFFFDKSLLTTNRSPFFQLSFSVLIVHLAQKRWLPSTVPTRFLLLLELWNSVSFHAYRSAHMYVLVTTEKIKMYSPTFKNVGYFYC